MPGVNRNLLAIAGACFIGFSGFTLAMPFLPLYFAQLGMRDAADIALWSGLSLGVTPGMTALLAPLWGRVADRYGTKFLVLRSLVCFVITMVLMGLVTRPWHIFGLRVLQGFFAGYGALAVSMAAQAAPRERMASAIGTVQTAQRLGPARRAGHRRRAGRGDRHPRLVLRLLAVLPGGADSRLALVRGTAQAARDRCPPHERRSDRPS